jgi:hypothetical protein
VAEAGIGTPFLDFFRRGEVDRDLRLMAARGELGLRDHEQRGLLELLVGDQDEEVSAAAREALRALEPQQAAAVASEAAGSQPETPDEEDEKTLTALQKIAAMSPAQRVALAMKGNREERAVLIRDPNKIVAVAVLSSPKITDTEVESIAKMANVSDEVLRIIGHTRAWVKNYGVVFALARNPKTPVAISLNMLSRLYEKDVKTLSTDRNIPDALRIAARKRLSPK